MSKQSDEKDPLLALRDGEGNFTEVAREIAAGVRQYDRAKKQRPKDVKVPGPERFNDLSDQPARNAELGIPFRTAPRSAAEAAARKEAATREELGLLPHPRPLTKPGLGPEVEDANQEDDDVADPGSAEPARAVEKSRAPTVLLRPNGNRTRLIAGLAGAGIVLAVSVGFFVGRDTGTPVAPTASSAPLTSSPVAPASLSVTTSAPAVASVTSAAPIASMGTTPTHAAPNNPPAPSGATSQGKPVPAPSAPPVVVTAATHSPPAPIIPAPAVSSGRLPFIPAPE